jgi:pantetheine-phosphate adenylyltransferase
MRYIFELRDPEHRKELSKPKVKIFKSPAELECFLRKRKPKKFITVGDIVSASLQHLKPDVCVVDYKAERKRIKTRVHADIELKTQNPRGKITAHAWNSVKRAVSHSRRVKIIVQGEEDLLVLPFLYFSPKNTIIAFGMRGVGIGILDKKRFKKSFVKKFIKIEKFKEVMCGGSFDHFHVGHKFFLLTAFEHGKNVTVGITSDDFLRKKIGTTNAFPYEKRKKDVIEFLQEFGLIKRSKIVMLKDMFGPALKRGEALLVTEDTFKNGKKLNKIRRKIGKKPLILLKINKILAADGKPISSSRIRNGEIDREGFLL